MVLGSWYMPIPNGNLQVPQKWFKRPTLPIRPELMECELPPSYMITGSRYSPKIRRKTPIISPRVAYV